MEAGHVRHERDFVGCIALPTSWDLPAQVAHLGSLESQIWDRRSRESKKDPVDEAAAGEEEDQPVLEEDAPS